MASVKFLQLDRALLDRRDLSLHQKIVLAFLAFRQRGNSESWPSIMTIADECGIAHRTATRAIPHLEKLGLILTERKAGQATRYSLMLDPLQVDRGAKAPGVLSVPPAKAPLDPRRFGPNGGTKRPTISNTSNNKEPPSIPQDSAAEEEPFECLDPGGEEQLSELDKVLFEIFGSLINVGGARTKAEGLLEGEDSALVFKAMRLCKAEGEGWKRWGWTLNRLVKARQDAKAAAETEQADDAFTRARIL